MNDKYEFICINPNVLPNCPSRKNNRCYCDGECHLKELYTERDDVLNISNKENIKRTHTDS